MRARCGRVLKMLAVAPFREREMLLQEVVTALIDLGLQEELDSIFVFTTADQAASFEALDFKPLVASGRSALLEYGDGLQRYLARHLAPGPP